jgi:hypothetical protein
MSARRSPKPIRVFYNTRSNRFYATSAYRQEPNVVVVTGEQFDVTNDIAELIDRHQIGFKVEKTDS